MCICYATVVSSTNSKPHVLRIPPLKSSVNPRRTCLPWVQKSAALKCKTICSFHSLAPSGPLTWSSTAWHENALETTPHHPAAAVAPSPYHCWSAPTANPSRSLHATTQTPLAAIPLRPPSHPPCHPPHPRSPCHPPRPHLPSDASTSTTTASHHHHRHHYS
jgi:hypothetical protein